MKNLNFEVGTFKEYQLNGKDTIRVNVSDPGIVNRFKKCEEEIDKIRAELGDDLTEENLEPIDKRLRAMVDGIINCPGACDKAFGDTHCLALAGGQPIIINFVQALAAQIADDMKEVLGKTAKATVTDEDYNPLINERTKKYITQSKPMTLPASALSDGAVGTVNVALLSQAERERLLSELLAGEPK